MAVLEKINVVHLSLSLTHVRAHIHTHTILLATSVHNCK